MKIKLSLLSLPDGATLRGLAPSRWLALPPVHRRSAVRKIAVIVVRGRNGANLIENHNPEERDGTFFGQATVGTAQGITRTFSIHNAGTAPLRLGRTALEGTGAEEFEVVGFPEATVAPGASTAFTIRYRGQRLGPAIALVLIPSNDPTERPYLFLIAGEACLPGSRDVEVER